MKIYDEIEQNTDEWKKCRSGHFTASMFSKLFMAKSTAGYRGAISQVVIEKLTGEVPESYQSAAMRRGHELEPEAIEAYELRTFNKVKRVGFIERDNFCGCSPDGIVGLDGGVEIKCPEATAFLEYLETGKIKDDYVYQIQGSLWVSERVWWDYSPYSPKLTAPIVRVYRDEGMIANIATAVAVATEEARKRIIRIQAMK